MSDMKDRENAFENKFAHDEKMSFDMEARTSKLFGLWAAEQLGIHDETEKQTYAKEVVVANLDEPGFDDIIRKVRADFEAKGIEFTEHTLVAQVDKAVTEAKKQLSE